MWEYNYTDELYHHGIRGMKWGVRRYQNYDGSYTKKGLKRYNDSMNEYNRQNERYKSAKKNKLSKDKITNARLARKNAKRKLEKDYKHLKQDKLGDKGKELYSKGKTITGMSSVTKSLINVGTMSATAPFIINKLAPGGKTIPSKYGTAMVVAGASAVAIGAAKGVKDSRDSKKLRAYYNHTSNY